MKQEESPFRTREEARKLRNYDKFNKNKEEKE